MTVESYAKQIDQFLNHLKLLSENQREVLIGENTTDITTTQGHLLMLLAQHGPQTNSELARALHVSGAAVTKAMKSLYIRDEPMVNVIPDPEDGRVSRWSLTTLGISLATAHTQRHRETVDEYQKLLENFSDSEQAVISRFLIELSERLEGDNK
ncbi:MarR family transcriptional regulator [Weissella paramesenteroides]|jgi:DNA-binding MarR family transcriptional regulator|uniref:MarR family transcriptional regulator n=1 Tax=Weissella paramesenteroides TaxID=1249 RepID=A0ABD4XGZ6_WEIPA|nr:MarR family transcriptional regulator [Weissella paramesenteroides]KAA8441889.1 MarR family transcriptional regulator [Weissella paramesenteroides]KAA8442133.1 MarR family transcriptional regulator [Weissella paramesenteroides]KAA8443526.1 MarR family transcriptional regulator [Weissella paramesenteroides]KAA8447031.1 MarR family transcriptional regulator [Weissella paramesenteroides]KAA8447519.1 MarR family transcriptional regulator [Weissella paramesenteroides]